MNLKGKHLMSLNDYSLEEINSIVRKADDMVKNRDKYAHICDGKILATCFYEPSTRTRLSFESAMLRMGGKVLGFADASNSSVAKGESIQDTVRTVQCYSDIIAMRHFEPGMPQLASEYCNVPLINGGDGGHEHPTQTLTDLVTIDQYRHSFDNMTIGLCGDLKNGRTVHSLITTMSRYNNNKFILISPDELKLPDKFKKMINSDHYIETTSMEEAMPKLDILYMTRIQRERFVDIHEYDRLKSSYELNAKQLEPAKKEMLVMHPLPRVTEIAYDVDNDPRAVYFNQAEYGVAARMSLMAHLLGLL